MRFDSTRLARRNGDEMRARLQDASPLQVRADWADRYSGARGREQPLRAGLGTAGP